MRLKEEAAAKEREAAAGPEPAAADVASAPQATEAEKMEEDGAK